MLVMFLMKKWPSVGDVLSYVPQQYTPFSSPKGQGPARPGVGSGLLWIQFHRLQRQSFLASGVCPLVDEAGRGTCESSMVGGLVPARG